MSRFSVVILLSLAVAVTAVAAEKGGKKGGKKKGDGDATSVSGDLVGVARDGSSITVQTEEKGGYQPGRSAIKRMTIVTGPDTEVTINGQKDRRVADLRSGQRVQVKMGSDDVAKEIRARDADGRDR